MAGVQTATLLVDGDAMKKQIMSRMNAMAYPFEHAFAEGVTVGAYMESEDWFEEVYRYIKENKEMTVQYIRKTFRILECRNRKLPICYGWTVAL